MKFAALLLFCLPAWASGVEDLSWIAGCWELKMGPVTIEEMWTAPAGGTLLGMGRTIKNGRAVFSEFLKIETKAGKIVYTPRIGTKQSPVDFVLFRSSADEVVFENPAHDFPQRIIYRKQPEGLFARIEGTDKGKQRGEDFPYKRVACPGAVR